MSIERPRSADPADQTFGISLAEIGHRIRPLQAQILLANHSRGSSGSRDKKALTIRAFC
jgi:hypothetical protein